MNSRVPTALLVMPLVAALTMTTASAQDTKKAPKQVDVETLRDQANPGPEHQQLAKYAGAWNTTMNMGVGERAIGSNGKTKSYMMMDGRFLWIAYNVAGKAGSFKGAFMLGFDRRNERYTLLGIDTHGTYFITSQGTRSDETGKIKLYGKDDDPHMKAMGFEKEFAHVVDFRGPDEFAIDVHYVDTRTPARREIKAMSFVFSRNKDAAGDNADK